MQSLGKSAYRTKRQLHSIDACIAARFDLVDTICNELEGFMKDLGLHEAIFNVLVGVREALINAVGHGAKENPLEQVCLFASLSGNDLVIKIKDQGEGFDWRMMIDSTGDRLKDHANVIPERGRGINILLHYFDSVSFNEKGNEVELHLTVNSSHAQK